MPTDKTTRFAPTPFSTDNPSLYGIGPDASRLLEIINNHLAGVTIPSKQEQQAELLILLLVLQGIPISHFARSKNFYSLENFVDFVASDKVYPHFLVWFQDSDAGGLSPYAHPIDICSPSGALLLRLVDRIAGKTAETKCEQRGIGWRFAIFGIKRMRKRVKNLPKDAGSDISGIDALAFSLLGKEKECKSWNWQRFSNAFAEMQYFMCRWRFPGFLAAQLCGWKNYTSSFACNHCDLESAFEAREKIKASLVFHHDSKPFVLPFTKTSPLRILGAKERKRKCEQLRNKIETILAKRASENKFEVFYEVLGEKNKYSRNALHKILPEDKRIINSYMNHLYSNGLAASTDPFPLPLDFQFDLEFLKELDSVDFFLKTNNNSTKITKNEQDKIIAAQKENIALVLHLANVFGARSNEIFSAIGSLGKLADKETRRIINLPMDVILHINKSKTIAGIRTCHAGILCPTDFRDDFEFLVAKILKNYGYTRVERGRIVRLLSKVTRAKANLHSLRHRMITLRLYEIFRTEGNSIQLFNALVRGVGHLHPITTCCKYVGSCLGGRMIPL